MTRSSGGPWLISPSARPTNVSGLLLSLTGAFNVESQPLAFPDVVWIDARRLQRADVEKHIRTAGVVCDETEAAVGIPHFQGSCSHCALFPLRLQPAASRLRRKSRTRSILSQRPQRY